MLSDGATESAPAAMKRETAMTPRLIQDVNGRAIARHALAGCPS